MKFKKKKIIYSVIILIVLISLVFTSILFINNLNKESELKAINNEELIRRTIIDSLNRIQLEDNKIKEEIEQQRILRELPYNIDGMRLSELEYRDYIAKQDLKKNKEHLVKLFKEYNVTVLVLGARKVYLEGYIADKWISLRNDMEIQKQKLVKLKNNASVPDKLLILYKSKLLDYINK